MGRTDQRMSERMRFVTFRVKCFLWTEHRPDEPMKGFGFAADISETGAGIYIDTKLTKGHPVRIAFEDADADIYNGVIAWCQRIEMSQRFHGHAKLDHRIGIRLRFESDGERQRYLMLFNGLRKRVTAIPGGFKF